MPPRGSGATRIQQVQPAVAIDRASARGRSAAYERQWTGQPFDRSCCGRRARSRDGSRQCRSRAERVANETNLLSIVTGKLFMSAAVAKRHRARSNHQRNLVLAQQGIEVHNILSRLCKRETRAVSQPPAPTNANAGDAPNVGIQTPITSSRMIWTKANRGAQPTSTAIGTRKNATAPEQHKPSRPAMSSSGRFFLQQRARVRDPDPGGMLRSRGLRAHVASPERASEASTCSGHGGHGV